MRDWTESRKFRVAILIAALVLLMLVVLFGKGETW
jgi:hypothetical protein